RERYRGRAGLAGVLGGDGDRAVPPDLGAGHPSLLGRGGLRMEHVRLFWLFARTSVQNDTEYRADFFAQILVTLLGVGTQLVAVSVIFRHTPDLAGWSLPQVLGLLGVYNLMYGFIGAVIAPNMRQVLEDVRQGTLDFALLKPINSQFLISVRQFEIWRLTDVFLGIALAIYASIRIAAGGGPDTGSVLAALAAVT